MLSVLWSDLLGWVKVADVRLTLGFTEERSKGHCLRYGGSLCSGNANAVLKGLNISILQE